MVHGRSIFSAITTTSRNKWSNEPVGCNRRPTARGKLRTSLVVPSFGRFRPEPLVSESVITDGQWYYVGFVWDGSNRALYLDGVIVAEDTQNGIVSSNSGLYIGCGKSMEPGGFFSGLIDDVRIYNRAVSP